MTAQTQPAQPKAPGYAADGKTPIYSIVGVGIVVRADEFNRLHAENEQLRATNTNLSDALAEIASGEILRSHCIGPHCTEEMGVATADELSSRAAGALDWEERVAAEAAHGIGEKTP